MDELLILFKTRSIAAGPGRTPLFSSGIAALALLKEGWCDPPDSCFANYTNPPALLAPRQHSASGMCYGLISRKNFFAAGIRFVTKWNPSILGYGGGMFDQSIVAGGEVRSVVL